MMKAAIRWNLVVVLALYFIALVFFHDPPKPPKLDIKTKSFVFTSTFLGSLFLYFLSSWSKQ